MWNSFCSFAISRGLVVQPSGQHWCCTNSITAKWQSTEFILIGKYHQWQTHFVLLQHAPALSHHRYPNIRLHLWRHPQLSTASSPLRPLLADGKRHVLDVLWVFVAVGRCGAAVTHAVPVCSLTPLPTPLRVPLCRLTWSQHSSRVWPWWLHACRLFRCPRSKRYTQI